MKPHVLSRAPKLIKFPQGGALPSSAAANGSDAALAAPSKGTKVNRTLYAWQLHPEFTGFMLGQQAPVAGELKTEWDDLCLDYNYGNGNVYMHPCHGGANQQWYFTATGELKTQWDDLCLDYNYNDGNVYMHPCHGGTNQVWHINTDGTMGTSYDGKCLDYNYNNMNVYMHDCHGQANQLWVHPQRDANIAAAQPVDEKMLPYAGEETYYSSDEEDMGIAEEGMPPMEPMPPMNGTPPMEGPPGGPPGKGPMPPMPPAPVPKPAR